jgi:hypothetical protein
MILIRAESDDDPDRCMGVGALGQCPYKKVAPSEYCMRHGANKTLEKQEKEKVSNYRLQMYRERVEAFAENPKVKNLREEVGILRMTLESIINRCKGDEDLLMYSNKISDLIMKIDKVVLSCNKLEIVGGQLLDRNAALLFATKIVNIIADHVEDEDIVNNISTDILQELSALQGITNVSQ